MCRLKAGLLCVLFFLFSVSSLAAQDGGTSSTSPSESEVAQLLQDLNNLLATLSDEVILSQEDLTKLQAELQTLSEQLEKALKSLKESQTEIQKLSDSLASCQKLLDDCKKLLAQREAELEAWRTAAIISAAVAVLAILANFVPR